MMDPQFVDMPEILCAGIACFGDNKAGEIPALWPVFNSLGDQIKHRAEPRVFLGVESYPPTFMTDWKWQYLAAAQVTSLEGLSVQLMGKVLPANRYAVFTHKGKLPGKIGEAFGYIYKTWLPKSGYRQAGPYDFERYDARFKGPDSDESVMEICVPILQQ